MNNTNKRTGMIHVMAERIRNGERLTVAEWAEEFDTTGDRIRQEMSRCRNHRKIPIYLAPLPPENGNVGGVVVDLMEKMENFRAVMADYDKRVVDHMVAGIRALENGLARHPQLMPFVREMINDLTNAADDGSRTLLLKK